MSLVIDKIIDLTTYEHNPSPKIVEQLSIVHESKDGDITQYYIVPGTKQAGDKESKAIGIYHQGDQNTPGWYTYNDYDELVWKSKKGSRITRQRITRLGIKAFPNVGAIAYYKLAYRNLSRILAPVNYVTHKYKAPILKAEQYPTYIHFTIIPPDQTNTAPEDLIEYTVYRICMQWNVFTLEYVTYDLEYDVPIPSTTGTYSCWCIGYVNEGEACSNESNVIDLDIQGTRTDWPDVTPGSEDIYIHSMHFDTEGKLEGTLTNGGIVASDNRPPIGDSVIVEQIIPKGTNIANLTVDGVTTQLFAPNSGGGGGASVMYGQTPPSSNLGSDGSLYIQYKYVEDTGNNSTKEQQPPRPEVVQEYIKIDGLWLPIDTGDGTNVYNIIPAVLNGTTAPVSDDLYEGQQYIQYGEEPIYNSALNWTSDFSDSQTQVSGWEFVVNEDITIIGLRGRICNNGTASLRIGTTSKILATVSDIQMPAGEWFDVMLDTPIHATTGEHYIVQILSSYGLYYYQGTPSSKLRTDKVSYVQSRYSSFPGSTESDIVYSADILIETGEVIEKIIASWYKLNGTPQPIQVSEQYSPTIKVIESPQGIVFDKVQYYNHNGTRLYHKEYVEVGGNAEWSTRDIWATTPNGQAVPGILQNITTNLNLYKAGLDKYIDLSKHINTDTDCTMINWNVDDGNTEIAVDPNDFKFYINNNYVTSITLNSNFYVQFNSQQININQRDNRSRRYGTAIIEGIDCKAFKIRFEGWAPYKNQDDAHLCIWELFLIDTGDAYIHLESVGANADWTGSFTFFDVPYTLNMNNVDVSFYRQESGSSIVWNVINKPYVVIEDPAG